MTAATVGSLIDAATGKTTPDGADQIGLMDSEESNVLKKLAWSDLVAAMRAANAAGFSRVRADTTTAQSVANTTVTTIVYDNEVEDTQGEYSTSTGVFTADEAGVYLAIAATSTGQSNWTVNQYWQMGIQTAVDTKWASARPGRRELSQNHLCGGRGHAGRAAGRRRDALRRGVPHQGSYTVLRATAEYNHFEVIRLPQRGDGDAPPQDPGALRGANFRRIPPLRLAVGPVQRGFLLTRYPRPCAARALAAGASSGNGRPA